MTVIGTAVLQVIPSLDGVSKSVEKQLGSLDGKKFGKRFGKDLADGVKASEADVKKAFEGHAKLADRAADATGKLKVAQAGYQDLIDKGVRSGQRYERAKAQVEKATRDEIRATRAATDALKEYEAAQKRAAQGVDNIGSGLGAKLKSLAGEAASGGADAASGFVEGFGGPIAALGTKAGPIGLALAAAAGLAAGAGVLIAQNVMAGMERELAADRIQAQLGLSDAEASRFGASAGRVYGDAFGESLGDVQQAMADVASTLNMSSGAALEDMTAKALTLRDVYSTDLAESIALAQNMVVNGLAPNASTAFDLMTTALQRVPAALRDETFEALEEYSVHLSSLGFTGEQAAGMIVGVADQGKYAIDKLGESLKEFGIKAQDLDDKGAQDVLAALGLNGQDVANNLLAGGERSAEQFDQVVDKLLGIQDPAQQAAAAIALFGTPLEDLGKKNIPAFLASLDGAESAMSGFSGSSQEMVDTVSDNAATSIEGAKRAIEGGLASMQTSMAQAFGPAAEQLAAWVIEHQDEITQFFATAANAAAEFGSAVAYTVGGIAKTLGELVSIVGDTSAWIIEGFSKIVGAAATVADALGQDGMAAELRAAQNSMNEFADGLHGWGEGMIAFGDSATDAAGKLHDFDAKIFETTQNAWTAADAIDRLNNAVAGGVGQTLGATPFRSSGSTPGSSTAAPTSFTLPSSASSSSSPRSSSSGGGGSSSSGGSSPSGSTTTRKVGSDYGLLPQTVGVKDQIATQFTDITDIGGWREPDGFNEHFSGRAIDVMIPNWNTAQGKAYGDQVVAEALANPNVQYVLWQQRQWNPDGSSSAMDDRGNPTQNHFDHAHIYTYAEPQGPHPTGTPQSMDSVTGGGAKAPKAPSSGSSSGPSVSSPGAAGGASGSSFNMGTSLSGIGSAVGEFAGGQIGSALDVLGIPDSPGWLQGISTFIGGMSVTGPNGEKIFGGGGGAGALGGIGSMFGNSAPAAAAGGPGGAAPPDGAHGTRAGQQPGPVYNIQTATVEDAFLAARRRENELALARLSSR